jgi:regulator of RNase E activity RraA
MNEMNWEGIRQRFLKLYVPAVVDVLDEMELEFQACDSALRPLELGMKVAGPAFTIKGQRSGNPQDTMKIGAQIIDNFTPGCVVCYDTCGDPETGHWGELWSSGAMTKGCVGCVLDGGIRDTAYIMRVKFPVFHRYINPNDARGRFAITDSQCEVNIGKVLVGPGDYVFGDYDGIVIIPKDLIIPVLEKAEAIVETENKIRAEVNEGSELGMLYKKYGRF